MWGESCVQGERPSELQYSENSVMVRKNIRRVEDRIDEVTGKHVPQWSSLVTVVSLEDWKLFEHIYRSEIEAEKTRADIDYLAMVGGVDLDE